MYSAWWLIICIASIIFACVAAGGGIFENELQAQIHSN
jgi:hypothetical protein